MRGNKNTQSNQKNGNNGDKNIGMFLSNVVFILK